MKKNSLYDSLECQDYWKKLCPNLHLCDKDYMKKNKKVISIDKGLIKTCKNRIEEEGYFNLGLEATNIMGEKREERFKLLIESIEILIKQGHPPSFILMYDEAWDICNQMSMIMQECTSGNKNNLDMLVWHINQKNGESGFNPHRDRQPTDIKSSFREDNSAKYSTFWMALTNSTPENSCLYFLPAQHDPGYYKGDSMESEKDPLQVKKKKKRKIDI